MRRFILKITFCTITLNLNNMKKLILMLAIFSLCSCENKMIDYKRPFVVVGKSYYNNYARYMYKAKSGDTHLFDDARDRYSIGDTICE